MRSRRRSTPTAAGRQLQQDINQAVDIREAVDEFMLKFFVALSVV